MKKIILFFTLLFAALPLSAVAAPVTTSAVTKTVGGQSITYTEAAASGTAYYRLTWMVVVRGGADVNVFKALVYSTGVTDDIDNMYCATTYAEIVTKAGSLSFAGRQIPADPATH